MKQNETIVKTPQQKALEQAGVTTEAVEKLRATAKTVKITGPDDKVGYAAVDRARIDCKNLRTTAIPDEYRRLEDVSEPNTETPADAIVNQQTVDGVDLAKHEAIEKDKETLREYVNDIQGVEIAMETNEAAAVAASVKATLLQWATWSMQKIDELG